MGMIKIDTLIRRREETFNKNTDTILESMAEVIDGAVSFLHLTEEIAQGQLEWQGVQMNEDIVLLTGIIKYPPGAQFATSEGEIMIVSEQTADYFTRIIRMGLPIDLVNKRSKEETMAFLSDLKEETDQEVDFVEFSDFDFDELSDEQENDLLANTDDRVIH